MAESNTEDCAGHGTQVASIIAGKNIGVAKLANIVSVKILDCNGEGTNSDLIYSLHWVLKNFKKPAIVNLSIGGPPSKLVDDAVNLIIDKGIPVVVAAGNSAEDACLQSPSGVDRAITVGASNQGDERARFSNFGKCIDIFAPGVGILCASTYENSMNGYIFSSGTSMAAPFVSGVLAQLLEQNSKISVLELSEKLSFISQSGVLNPISLMNSPNILVQSVPSTTKLVDIVDLNPSSTLPWRPAENELPETLEIILITTSVLVIIPLSISLGIYYYLRE